MPNERRSTSSPSSVSTSSVGLSGLGSGSVGSGRRLIGQPAGSGRRGARRQGLLEVRNQVLRRLDTDRQADEVGGHLEGGAGDRGVGHDRRHLDERFDRAQRLGQGEDARRARHPVGDVRAAADLEREHAAGKPHLAPDEVRLGVARRPG